MRRSICSFAAGAILAALPASAQMVLETAASGSDASVFEASTEAVVNNGLSARVLFVSKAAGAQRTVSVELKNMRDEPIWLSIIGPSPMGIDTNGGTYAVTQISGLSTCKQLESKYIDSCMTNRADYLPGSTMSLLSPGASSLVNLALQSPSGESADTGFLSLTMNAALGVGDPPANAGDRGLISIPISFPLISLEAK